MNSKKIARFCALGAFLALCGNVWAEAAAPAVGAVPAAESAVPAAGADKADGGAPGAEKAGESRPKDVRRSSRRSNPTRHARRQGAGPQDRSEQAKRHQGRMMGQSARRPGAVSRQAERNRPQTETPAVAPAPAGESQ